MRKLLLVSLLGFMIFTQIAFAADFTVEIDGKDSYRAGVEETVTLTITNNGIGEWFNVAIIGSNDDWIDQNTINNVKVPTGESKSFDIFITPGKDAIPISYEYDVSIKKLTPEEKVSTSLLIPVVQVTDLIVGDFDLSCYECENQVTATGAIYNIGTRDVPAKLIISFNGEERIIESDNLESMKEESFSETFDISGLTPKIYEIEAIITSKQALMFEDVREFMIPQIQDITFSEKSFNTPFGRFVSVVADNKANYQADVVFTSNVNKKWYILYTGPDAEIVDVINENEEKHQWVITLDADEDYTLSYTEIYWPTYIIFAIILIIGFMLYLNHTAISLRKAIEGKNVVKMGRELSVSLTVRNRIRNITNLIVKDVIPEGFGLVTNFATVKPTLRKTHAGTEVIWKIGDMKPQEQRVLHYKMKPLKAFKGRKHLEKAGLICKHGEKIIREKSNLVSIYSEDSTPSILSVEINK